MNAAHTGFHTGFHTGIFPGRGKCTCVQRIHVHIGAPPRVFVDFIEILDTFKIKNRQILL